MHELALMESLVSTVMDNVGEVRVTAVRLDVGKLTCVAPDALRFCFDVCSRGTPLEGARLEIAEIGGAGRCRRCGADVGLDGVYGECVCGSLDVAVERGHELQLREVEVI